MLDTLIQTFGTLPMPAKALSIPGDCQPERCIEKAQSLIKELDQGQGCLVFTDIFGATPSNIAHHLASEESVIITGVSLPMLFRVLNYPNTDLDTLAEKAVNAGHEGIISTLD